MYAGRYFESLINYSKNAPVVHILFVMFIMLYCIAAYDCELEFVSSNAWCHPARTAKTTVLHHPLPGDGSSAKRFLMLIMFFVVEGICSVEALSPIQQRAPPKSSPLPCWHKDSWFGEHVPSAIHSELAPTNSSKSLLYFPQTLLNMSHTSMVASSFFINGVQWHFLKMCRCFPKGTAFTKIFLRGGCAVSF